LEAVEPNEEFSHRGRTCGDDDGRFGGRPFDRNHRPCRRFDRNQDLKAAFFDVATRFATAQIADRPKLPFGRVV
jgi:hypothetical protein